MGLTFLTFALFYAPHLVAGPVVGPSTETVVGATCSLIEGAAASANVSLGLLTRLVWAESRFRASVTSPAGAQGIAQFMPATAAQRGLLDPYDPEQAIPAAARLLVDLDRQFGNIGLAAAAYNAGSARVAAWLDGAGSLPRETRAYVFQLTGRTAEDWAAAGRASAGVAEFEDGGSCLEVSEALRAEEGAGQVAVAIAPWGVQLAGNFSKAIALASFERARQNYAGMLGSFQPMVIGTRMLSRGTRPFYRVMVPARVARAGRRHLQHDHRRRWRLSGGAHLKELARPRGFEPLTS
jgi:hypothetical protein